MLLLRSLAFKFYSKMLLSHFNDLNFVQLIWRHAHAYSNPTQMHTLHVWFDQLHFACIFTLYAFSHKSPTLHFQHQIFTLNSYRSNIPFHSIVYLNFSKFLWASMWKHSSTIFLHVSIGEIYRAVEVNWKFPYCFSGCVIKERKF